MILVTFLLLTLSSIGANAYERVTYIETPKISTGIDIDNEMPVNIVKKIPKNQKVIYASAFSHNALAEDTVTITWYYYKGKKAILIKKETKDATGHEFVYSSLESKNGIFPAGWYAVVFRLGLAKQKYVYFNVTATNNNSHNTQTKYWHYDASKFKGYGSSASKRVEIEDVALKKIKWNKKEKRIGLLVKTKRKTYRDNYIFCQKEPKYYYCGIEDDGGYVKINKNMGIELKVDFAQEAEGEEPILAFHIENKKIGAWVKPSSAKYHSKGKCFNMSVEADKRLFHSVLQRYNDIPTNIINKMEFARFYDTKDRLSLIIPANWNDIAKEGDAIVYLLRSDEKDVGKFMLRTLAKFWTKSDTKRPKQIIKRASRLIAEITSEEAEKSDDKATKASSLKLFESRGYTIGHFVMHRTGTKTRWESYTLIWSGDKLYILAVMGKENELALVEFLASLGMKSFCSDRRVK